VTTLMPLENILRSEFFAAVGTFYRIHHTVMGKHKPSEARITTTIAMKPIIFAVSFFAGVT